MHQTKAGPGAVSPGDSKAPHRPASAPPRPASAKAGPRRAWTPEDQARAEELRAQGLGYRAIGRALGRADSVVRCRLDPAGADATREKWRRWQQANHEKTREAARRWREENPEQVREAVRRWCRENPEKHREISRRWREANPEKVRRYREANPEKQREAARRWREANPEKKREAARRWREANPEKVLEKLRRRSAVKRAGRKAALAPLTLQQKAERFALFGDRCAFCGVDAKHPRNHGLAQLTVEHVLALSKGGLDEAANVIPACDRCNSSKNDRPVEEWFRRQPFFTEARWKLIRRHAPAAAGGQPSLALGLQALALGLPALALEAA